MTRSADQASGSRQIAIVGAGPGGLAAAMLLAQAGCDVTVYERHNKVGGRSAAIEKDGFRFDRGPTFFLYPQVLRDIFTQCGFDLDSMITLERLDNLYDLAFENGPTLHIARDRDRLRREISKLDAGDATRLDSFFADNRRKFDRVTPVLQRAFGGVQDLLRLDLLTALPAIFPPRSVDQELLRYFRDPRTRLAFSFQSKYLGMSPYRCPGLFTILGFMEHEFGIFHPIGGTQSVVDAMHHAACALGVRFQLDEAVREVCVEKGRATGVRLDSGTVTADAVVINADFAQAMTTLVAPDARHRWTDKAIGRKKYSCSTFMMYLGIEGTFPEQAHHTVVLSSNYNQNLSEIESGHALPGRPSFYVQNAGRTDPSLAPPGHSTLYVLMPLGHLRDGGMIWCDEMIATARALILARLKEAGFGDLEPRIRFEKIITPQDWETDHDIYRGAVFNLAHTFGQMLHRRPHNRFEDIDSLYLVGGGTHPGSGLPVIFEGARISCDLLIDDLSRVSAHAPAEQRSDPRLTEFPCS